jgi:hypothetical protein
MYSFSFPFLFLSLAMSTDGTAEGGGQTGGGDGFFDSEKSAEIISKLEEALLQENKT